MEEKFMQDPELKFEHSETKLSNLKNNSNYHQKIQNLVQNDQYQIHAPKQQKFKVPNHKLDSNQEIKLKMIKNRESAKNSRQRKKIYIELLQQTSSQLKQQIAEVEQQIKLQDSQKSNISELNQFLINEQNLLQMIYRQDGDEMSKQIIIDSYKFRFGSQGNQRRQILQQLNNEVLQIMAPQHLLYFFYCVQNNRDLFGPDHKEALYKFGIRQDQFEQIQQLKSVFMQQSLNFDNLIKKFMNQQIGLMKEIGNLDQSLDQLMNPQKFIYYLDMLFNNPQLLDTLNKKFWDLEDNDFEQFHIKKKTKLSNELSY